MLRQFSTKRIVGFFLLDWFGTLVMLLLAAFLRVRLGDLPEPLLNLVESLNVTLGGTQPGVASSTILSLSTRVVLLVAVIWPAMFVVFSVYDGRRNETLKAELRHVLLAICASSLTLAGVLYLTYRETSRGLFVLFFVLDVTLVLGSRTAMWAYRRSQNGRQSGRRQAVIVIGAGPVGCRSVERLTKYAWADIKLVGYVDDDRDKQGKEFDGLSVLGTLDQVSNIVQTYDVRVALVALPLQAHERLVGTCRTLQDLSVHVHVIPDFFALSFPSATLDGFGGIPVIDLGRPGIYGWLRVYKRVFDTAVASLILALLSPLFFLIALLIKLESPGPVIYKQQRIGENGQPFSFLKFRSMRAGADAKAHQAHVARLIEQNLNPEDLEESGPGSLKMEDDPRITRVGKFIRKTSLDELPQFINVIEGDMSLVGPRPPIPYEVELYQEWHKRRFEALPGITGWWQVKGRNRVSFDEMIRMDIHYIENMSLWLDIKILLMTPWAAISGKGAG